MSAPLEHVQPVSVVQISDTHLGSQVGDKLLGMDTDASLASVLELLAAEHSNPDLMLATGDLANSGCREAYARISRLLAGRADRIAWLPGNHDENTLMQEVGPAEWMVSRVDLGAWQVLLLDSSVPGEVGGSLAREQLDVLQTHLDSHPEQFVLLFLHHHVLPVGCAWLDEQRVDNADRLLALLARYPNVRMVVSGHVHQVTERVHGGIPLITSPSTCVQFAPGSEDFAIDLCNPGYRWFRLHANGELETDVSRVSGVTFEVDTQAQGYE